MKHTIRILLAAGALALGFAAPAEAYPYHGGGGYYHGGGGIGLSFYSGPAYYPAYYAYPAYPAYAYPTYYYPDPYGAPPAYAQPPQGYAPPPQGYAPPQGMPPQGMQPQADNSYCREYHDNVLINGHYQQTYGTACQQPDGTWKLVN